LSYTTEFYDHFASGSRSSASEVIPQVLDLIGPVRSVLDVGCGIGTWLTEFADKDVREFVGVDGSYVDLKDLLIPPERFHAHDLTTPLELGRIFDLVCSLEVAEHIDIQYSTTFVASLCDHASETILFSAAIPGQGGAYHVNEQWPSFWADLFAKQGFGCFDVIRPRIWHNSKVESWYRQNVLLFARGSTADRLGNVDPTRILDVVHPGVFAHYRHRTPRDALREELPAKIQASSLLRPVASAVRQARKSLLK
jgi:SAM-dependent methyltransferase